ncbi:HEAT repeat domain-containing protein [Dyadobacter psychrotolerans]|uniref:HEAT repeat domain-containing protein n=1 Tax=Dyadobacter psychrotolerans TaxID=2541721 RepID=A0A4R5DPM8_9BACT|nr:HEAT repeat domain-containing protein [Dyadobacter psychrotolerans]TDE12925.1 HEAT repeat domain-containing protein [Dyadobacter psychrotolerans]
MNQDIEKLLEKYYDGETTLEEEKDLRRFFLGGNVPVELKSHATQFGYFESAKEQQPSMGFNSKLAAKLDPPKSGPVRRFTSWVTRIAAGLALLLVGFGGGWIYFRMQPGSPEVAHILGDTSSEIKKVLAFEQMPVTSASDRIQAVNQSLEFGEGDREITQLLINTLNFDPNINVRLAACEALIYFENEPEVSEALIQSLGIQTDPNLQITLIEALVTLKEKRAVDQFQQIAANQDILDIVRLKAREGLGRLVTEEKSST